MEKIGTVRHGPTCSHRSQQTPCLSPFLTNAILDQVHVYNGGVDLQRLAKRLARQPDQGWCLSRFEPPWWVKAWYIWKGPELFGLIWIVSVVFTFCFLDFLLSSFSLLLVFAIFSSSIAVISTVFAAFWCSNGLFQVGWHVLQWSFI